MYNLIEYSNSYSKTLGILWHHCRDEPALNDNDTTAAFTEVYAITDSFKARKSNR